MTCGREVELATMGKGAVLGELALIDGKPRSASAKALVDSVVIIIDADTFHEKIKDVPQWFMSIIKMTSYKIRQANLRLQNISGEHQGANIAIGIYYLINRFSTSGEGLALQAIQIQLITLLGTTHQKIVHMLEFLQKNNFISICDGKIMITDFFRYKEYCEYLRLLIRKCFEKIHPLTPDISNLVQSITVNYHQIKENNNDVTEISGADFYNQLEKTNLIESSQSILENLRELELISFTKTCHEKKQNPLDGYIIRINNSGWKRIYLSEKYKDYKPIL